MQDLIAGFQAAPLWAQIGMVLFAILAVVMIAGPTVKTRKFRRHFDEIARELSATPARISEWPITFPTRSGDRPFEVRYDLRVGSTRHSSYRGPRGSLLITASRLAGTKWGMHQVDIAPIDKWLSRLVSSKRPTGDPNFDSRFVVTEDGLPVREGWLDAGTREAITRFFEGAPLPGVLWIREGELQFIMQDPWTGIDGKVLRGLLDRQAVLASTLDRTARGRA